MPEAPFQPINVRMNPNWHDIRKSQNHLLGGIHGQLDSQSRSCMNNFRDFSALHNVLRIAYKECSQEGRRAVFADKLQEVLGFTKQQAQLYASTVLCQNAEGSADWVTTNGSRVSGSWVRGEQQGNVGGWLRSMKETWQFDDDLTYTHKIEKSRVKYINGAVLPIFLFPTNDERGARHLGAGRYDTRSARVVCDVLQWFRSPDDA